jgi:hypothetical protein
MKKSANNFFPKNPHSTEDSSFCGFFFDTLIPVRTHQIGQRKFSF